MQLSSTTNSYAGTISTPSTTGNQNAMKDLEKQKTEQQADIQEAYQSEGTAEANLFFTQSKEDSDQ
ncbi:hypothetical protein ACQKL0_00425 [Peribacillus sp. NPDC097264]|uniref:hypothetical protein n=1 Tax=unclassified Peribacillus TaxID=2675266 RepID=UPI003803A52D